MPQPIAYNSGNPISGSIEKSTLSFTVEGAPRDERDYSSSYAGVDWYSTIPPQDGKYVIISASNPPQIWVTADETDAELLITINGLPDRYNQTLFTDTGSALDYLAQNAYFVSRETPDQIDADSMVLNLDAGLESSYPRTGSNWYDLSGDGNTGVLTNGPVFSDGVFTFDGVDDKVLCGNSSSLDFGANEPLTVCSLIKHTDNNSGYDVYAAKHSGTTGWISNLRWNGGVHQLRWWVNGGVLVTYTPTKPYLNRWRYVCMQIDDSFIGSIFEDGIKVASGSVSTNSPSNSGQFQVGNDDFNSAFKGEISLTQLYSKALTETEVKQNYYGGPIVTDGLVLAVDASNLVSYESGSTTTYSLTGSLSGSLINGVGYLPDNGGAWAFDGTNDYIPFPTVLASELIGDGKKVTISLWVNPDQHADKMPFSTGQTGDDRIYYWTVSGVNTWRVGNYVSTTGHGTLPPIGEWYNTTLVIDSNNVTVYLNGKLDYTGSFTTFTTAHYATLGRHGLTSAYYYDGKIGNVLIYDGKALTAEEVAQNYSATKQKYLF